MRMLRGAAVLAVAALALGACGKKPAATPAPTAAPMEASPRELKEYMAHAVQWSAYKFWKWQGWVTDASGSHSRLPKTEEEWEDAESAAITLHELTFAMSTPARRRGGAAWDAKVLELRNAAATAATAAEKKDGDTLSKASDRIEEACRTCHYEFAAHLEGPPPANP